MNHQSIVSYESARPYGNRNYFLGLLDKSYFDALNTGGHVLGLNGYCLDALDEIPAGCMRPVADRPGQHFVSRGVSLQEQQEQDDMAKRYVEEILTELANG